MSSRGYDSAEMDFDWGKNGFIVSTGKYGKYRWTGLNSGQHARVTGKVRLLLWYQPATVD